jgi:ribulose-5-phosphate 4-epimerase/fuculose-1-phosphate aldolase
VWGTGANKRKETMHKPPASLIHDRLAAEVAAATRLLVMEGILDYSGHISARVPGGDAFVIQPRDHSRAEVTPGCMLLVDFGGKVVAGNGTPPSETPLHIEIFRARPDVQAVLHCHMELAIAFTMMEGVELKPMRARAVRWESGIPTHPDPSHIKLTGQARALATTLGPHHAVLMRAHGVTLVAESAPALLVDAVHFRENATALLQVLQAGARALPLTASELAQINRHETRDAHVPKLWNYYVRKCVSAGVLPPDWPLLEPNPRSG